MESIKDRIGQYELIEEISRSSTTSVFKAYQANLERWVLVKQLHSHLTQEEDIVQRFEREAKAAARIKHENIVDIYDFGLWEDIYYIALEYVDGISLQRVIHENGRLPLHIAVAMVYATVTGLAYAHSKGVFHRDMKPANILISMEGTVKITDFGLAIISDYPSITAQDGIVGTPAYMSPEQANGEDIDGRSDIFSLGLTFYEMLTGQRAYTGDSFSACITKLLTEDPPRIEDIRQDVPKDIAVILDRMTRRDISKRYQLCDDIITDMQKSTTVSEHIPRKADLATYIATPQQVHAESPPLESRRTGRKKRYLSIAAAAAVVSILIISGYVILKNNSDSQSIQNNVTQQMNGQVTNQNATTPLHDSLSLSNPTVEGGISDSIRSSTSTGEDEPAVQPTREELQPKETDTTMPLVELQQNEPDQTRPDDEQSVDSMITIPPEMTGSGMLEIHCYPWANVIINNQPIGATPLTAAISLESGRHTIIFDNPNYLPYVETIEILPGERKKIDVTIVGFLDVKATPWAIVYMNGALLDTTPFIDPDLHMVSPGNHILRLENPNFGYIEEDIAIAAGETLTVDRDLTKLSKD